MKFILSILKDILPEWLVPGSPKWDIWGFLVYAFLLGFIIIEITAWLDRLAGH